MAKPNIYPEAQAIYLAYENKLPLLIEETLGRRIAQNAGIEISGICGQIIKALKLTIIDKKEAKKLIQSLFENGRINKKIYYKVLETIK